MKKTTFILFAAFFVSLANLALASPVITPSAGGNQSTTSPGGSVPEIPVGAAPLVVAGIVGAAFFIRSRRNKAK